MARPPAVPTSVVPLRAGARMARAFAAAGSAVVVLTSLLNGPSLLLVPFVAWALVPYGVLALAGSLIASPWIAGGAGAAALAAEIGVRLSVFVYPRGSTAALALIFSPAVIALVFLPAGAACGFVVGRMMATRRLWLQAPALALAVGSLALTVLGLGRPELFPTTAYARQQSLSRIGAPRVALGASAFAREVVSATPGWRLAGEFDGEPGDEIALVSGTAVRLLDAATFALRGEVPVSGETARWNWFSRLARQDGRLVRVDEGGGFQPTVVRELDGTLLWAYHPDPQLPPTALRAGDLDGDGRVEYYATSTHRLARLDGDGHEVWTQPLALGQIVDVLPRTEAAPAWIVTTDNAQRLAAWTDDGRPIAARPAAGGGLPLGAVDWIGGRSFAIGGRSLQIVQPDGTITLDWTVADMSIVQVKTVRFGAGAPPVLALIAAAPRDTKRWRLQMLDANGSLVYDEVLDHGPALVTAHRADGTGTLLVSGAALEALGPVEPVAAARAR